MAEGSLAATGSKMQMQKPVEPVEPEPRLFDKVIKEAFSSAIWYYTIHKYIGDIVQSKYHSVNFIACRAFICMDICVENDFNIDYESERKRAYFDSYCDTVRLPITFSFSHAYQYIILYRFLSS